MKFIYGQEPYLVDKEVRDLISTSCVAPFYYDEDTILDDIILDICTIGLFANEKLIIIKNHPVFNKPDLAKKLIKELINLPKEVNLVFVLETEMLDKKAELVKFLLTHGEVKEMSKVKDKDVVSTIKDIVNSKGGKISNSAAIMFSIKVPNSLYLIIREIEKLLLESNDITSEMVDISIGNYVKDDYFALSNALVENDAHGIMHAYKERILNGDQPSVIISQISSIFSLASIVSAYKKQGLSNADISEKTFIHIFRIKKAAELISLVSENKIEDLIINLANLDQDIKTGKTNTIYGLEVFLLKLLK